MKNRTLIILAAAGVIGLLAASCGNSPKPADGDKGVELKVKPERNGGAPESLQLTITNHSDSTLHFGADYGMERLVEGEWMKHDLGNFAVILIMYNLPSGKSGEYKINLFTDRVEYPEGEYRVVKTISSGDNPGKPYYGYFKIIEPR